MKRLGTARDHLDAQEWEQGLPILQQIIETAGDTLLAVETGRYWNAADFCHLLISEIPGQGLAVYRDRVDPQAAEWLKMAEKNLNPALFERVVRTAFNSSSGDDALWHLGSLAFEQGRYVVARQHWQLLVAPVRSPDTGDVESESAGLPYLTFPDSSYAAASVRARLILCTIFEGDRQRVERELAVFEQLHAAAEGSLAGQSGRLSEILRAVLEESQGWWLGRSVPDEFLTFAGRPTRNPQPASEHSPGRRLWTRRLPDIRFRGPAPPALTGPQRLLSYFPVVYRDTVYLCTSHSIFALDLATGDSPQWRADEVKASSGQTGAATDQSAKEIPPAASDGSKEFDGESQSTALQADSDKTRIFTNSTGEAWRIIRNPIGITRYTMTLAEGRLYARMGPPVSRRSPNEGSTVSEIVGLDIESRQGLLVFRVSSDILDPDASSPEATAWSFEGTPVVENGRVYASARRATPEDEVVVACFDASSSQLLWQQRICSNLQPLSDRSSLLEHRLLSLADGRLFLATGTGAIACLDAATGRILWVFTYDNGHRPVGHRTSYLDNVSHPSRNGLMPCVIHRGMVFAATTDSNRLFALDATTGQLVWQIEYEPGEWLRHLLGVVDGRLITCGNHLAAVDIFSGKTVWKISHPNPDGWTHGRGVLTKQSVYWPLRHEILRVDLSSGKIRRRFQLTRSDGLEGGHLMITGGRMLVVTHNQISALRDGDLSEDQAVGDDAGFGQVVPDEGAQQALRRARAAEDAYQPIVAVERFQTVLNRVPASQLVPEQRNQAEYIAARGVVRSARILASVTSDQVKRSYLETHWRTISDYPRFFSNRETVQAAVDYVGSAADPHVLDRVRRFLESSGLQTVPWHRLSGSQQPVCETVATALVRVASGPVNPAPPVERIRARGDVTQVPEGRLQRTWTRTIEPHTRVLVPRGSPGGLCRQFLLQNAELTCHDVADGRVLWETTAADKVTGVMFMPADTTDRSPFTDRLFLIGIQAVQCRDADTGEVCWVKRWMEPVRFHRPDHATLQPYLLAVTAGSVTALAVRDGAELWQCPSRLQSPGIPNSGRSGDRSQFFHAGPVGFFQPHGLQHACLIHLQTGCVMAQVPASRTLPRTGSLILAADARSAVSPESVTAAGPYRWSVAGISQGNRLRVVHFHSGQQLPPSRPRKLGTGLGPPVLLADVSPFTVLIENGLMAERIDVRTGTRVWRVRMRSVLKEPASMTALTGTSLFAVSDGFLSRFDLQDGSMEWQRYSGEGTWQIVRATEKFVLLAGGQQAAEDSPGQLIVCDAQTGQPVQQLRFTHRVRAADIRTGSACVFVRSGDSLHGLAIPEDHSPMPTTSFRLR
ncbi:MAG: PQQ-binding-like beta-propeller repeat protein [Planctomycetaceae bacterium]